MELVDVAVESRVAVVTVNRPEAMNAFNTEVLTTLAAALTSLGPREDVGAVVITGAGSKAFVAGADIAEMKDKSPAEARVFAELGQSLTTTIEGLPQPVIAAVNGFALGGGCELALACDIRVCSEAARFGQPEINLGIIPGWGGSQRLSRLCGPGFARELVYTGRMVDAAEALHWGLVNAVYPPEELMPQAMKLAQTIAGKSRVALQYAKVCCNRAFDQDLAGGLRLEAASEDQSEGMDAFLSKRSPEFKHR
jgi:enoyl-CoA hydratase